MGGCEAAASSESLAQQGSGGGRTGKQAALQPALDALPPQQHPWVTPAAPLPPSHLSCRTSRARCRRPTTAWPCSASKRATWSGASASWGPSRTRRTKSTGGRRSSGCSRSWRRRGGGGGGGLLAAVPPPLLLLLLLHACSPPALADLYSPAAGVLSCLLPTLSSPSAGERGAQKVWAHQQEGSGPVCELHRAAGRAAAPQGGARCALPLTGIHNTQTPTNMHAANMSCGVPAPADPPSQTRPQRGPVSCRAGSAASAVQQHGCRPLVASLNVPAPTPRHLQENDRGDEKIRQVRLGWEGRPWGGWDMHPGTAACQQHVRSPAALCLTPPSVPPPAWRHTHGVPVGSDPGTL